MIQCSIRREDDEVQQARRTVTAFSGSGARLPSSHMYQFPSWVNPSKGFVVP